jgi:hypothetical protein
LINQRSTGVDDPSDSVPTGVNSQIGSGFVSAMDVTLKAFEGQVHIAAVSSLIAHESLDRTRTQKMTNAFTIQKSLHWRCLASCYFLFLFFFLFAAVVVVTVTQK